MFGGPGGREFLAGETRKPQNTSRTLARLGQRFAPMVADAAILAGLHRHLHLGAGDHPRADRSTGGLLPHPVGGQRLRQFSGHNQPGEFIRHELLVRRSG